MNELLDTLAMYVLALTAGFIIAASAVGIVVFLLESPTAGALASIAAVTVAWAFIRVTANW